MRPEPDVLVDRSAEQDLAAALNEAARGGADVIAVVLWGPSAPAAMEGVAPGARHVQVGHMDAKLVIVPGD